MRIHQPSMELSGEADLDEVLCKAEYAEFLRKNSSSNRSRRSCSPFLDDTWRSNVKSDPFSNLWRMSAASPFPMRKLQRYGTGKSIPQPSEKFENSGAIERFPGRTVADLFIWMWRREPELQIYCAETSDSEHENAPFSSLRRSFRKLSASVRRIFL